MSGLDFVLVGFAAVAAGAVNAIASGGTLITFPTLLAVGALAGGTLGGRVARHVKPDTLRWTVVSIGLVLAAIYFIR